MSASRRQRMVGESRGKGQFGAMSRGEKRNKKVVGQLSLPEVPRQNRRRVGVVVVGGGRGYQRTKSRLWRNRISTN